MNLAFTKETVLYFIPTIVQILMSPISIYFYTHALTRSDYGIWGLISVTAGLMAIFSNWGLINGMVRFIGEPNEDRNKLIGTAYYGSLWAGLTVFGLFYFGSTFFTKIILGSLNYRYVFILGVSSVVFGLTFQTFQNLMRMERKPGVYASFEVAQSLCAMVAGIYFVYVLRLGILGVILSSLIVQIVFAIIQYYYLNTRYKLLFSWPYFKKLVFYGAPFTIIIIGTWVLDWSDRYILELFVSMSDLGLYTIAYSYGMVTQAFVTPFILAVLPYLFDYYRAGQYSQKTGDITLHYIVVYMGIVLILTILAKPYFLILTPEQFHPAIHIAPLISLCYAWRGLFNIFCFCNTLTGNAKVQFFIEVGAALLNIAVNFALIPFLGLYGAVVATLIAWLYMLIFGYIYNQKILPIVLPKKQIVQVVGIGLSCFGAITILNVYRFWYLGTFFFFLYVLFIHYKILSLTPVVNMLKEKLFKPGFAKGF